jgi:hypothetical protein
MGDAFVGLLLIKGQHIYQEQNSLIYIYIYIYIYINFVIYVLLELTLLKSVKL